VATTSRGNSIFGNAGLGIDLNADGVTANDTGDADTGPNNLQNFPVLTGAIPGATTAVKGTFNGAASTTFTLDFYANPTGDPTGFGEGQIYLGALTVTTDASGNASYSGVLSAATTYHQAVTATATDAAGNTSEFAANFLA